MLDFLKQEETFHWGDIGNISAGRENLGEEMPVYLYRLFQFTMKSAMVKKYGKEETIKMFQIAGELAGEEFAQNMLDLTLDIDAFFTQIQERFIEHKIGIFRVEKFDAQTGRAIVTIGEDLDCSGLPVTGETVCNYDEGFLAGILKQYTKKEYDVIEIDCWSTGSRVYRFDANMKK